MLNLPSSSPPAPSSPLPDLLSSPTDQHVARIQDRRQAAPLPRTPARYTATPRAPPTSPLATQLIFDASGSDDSVEHTSPASTKSARIRKGHKKRIITRRQNLAAEREAAAALAEQKARLQEEKTHQVTEDILKMLKDNDINFGVFLTHVFDTRHTSRSWRWFNFFEKTETLYGVLERMVSKTNSKEARRRATGAMTKVVLEAVSREAEKITSRGILRAPAEVDEDFVLGSEFAEHGSLIQKHCPIIMRLLMGIARTPHQAKECSEQRLEHKKLVSPYPSQDMY